MHEVDGSAGGGQILRSALALSTLSETSVRVDNVRGSRSNPGLKAQHAAAVEAAAQVSNAEVDGGEIGSETVRFDPGDVTGGEYEVDVGTAGSVTLVFETVLPMALAADAPVRLCATGGTDVAWSPTLDHFTRVKLPLLRAFGFVAAVDRERRGFYPVGGGAATLTLAPSTLDVLDFPVNPDVAGVRIFSTAADDLRDPAVAERMAASAAETVEELAEDGDGDLPEDGDGDLPISEEVVRYVDADSPGAVIVIVAEADVGGRRVPIAGFDAIGERGTPAEDVADNATDAFARFLDSRAAVDRHLADQLVLSLAIAGGEIRIPELTAHVETSLDLLGEFGVDVDYESRGDGGILQSLGTTL